MTTPDPTPPRAETVTLPRETVERLISVVGVIGLCKAAYGYPSDYWCGRAETLETELVAACRAADEREASGYD